MDFTDVKNVTEGRGGNGREGKEGREGEDQARFFMWIILLTNVITFNLLQEIEGEQELVVNLHQKDILLI